MTLDQFDLIGGLDLYHYHCMEKGISESEDVTIVCDPGFKQKPDNRQGGAGDEMRIAAALLADNMVSSKSIPILRVGERSIVDLTWLQASVYIDFRDSNVMEPSPVLVILTNRQSRT